MQCVPAPSFSGSRGKRCRDDASEAAPKRARRACARECRDVGAVTVCECGERLWSETRVRALVASLVDAELERRAHAWRSDECSYIN